jgi:hypothetical protein
MCNYLTTSEKKITYMDFEVWRGLLTLILSPIPLSNNYPVNLHTRGDNVAKKVVIVTNSKLHILTRIIMSVSQ